MNKKIKSALISVFYKDGLESLALELQNQQITIYSTGGTQTFLEEKGIKCIPVEEVTHMPSILGGRVKTLHPKLFGGILARRNNEQDVQEMKEHGIPEIDLVIVDLYPFEETVANTTEEKLIIEKIDIGGPSMIRAAAKNFEHTTVLASKDDYSLLETILKDQQGETTLDQRKTFAQKAFNVVFNYDHAIANYFNGVKQTPLRYGENPHQTASFNGNLNALFTQLHGKELSYNNLVDVDAALQLIGEFAENETVFAIIKHTNVCGISLRSTVLDAWTNALAGDPESAFGGVLVTNGIINTETAQAINELFFEVLIATDFTPEALTILQQKKNRILIKSTTTCKISENKKSILNGELTQTTDIGNVATWQEVGARETTEAEKIELKFANIVCKHLKSNAIAIVKNNALIGKGCGQTSRIDALNQAIEKATHFNFDLQGASLASDAFFPFDDCIKIAFAKGITNIIQPGGSVRDKDSIAFAQENNVAMVMTGMRHFKH
jgi:phosphoribosylaminoimidazolecarboxamide formyltransferase/IMP cyclohydrolase